MPALLATGDLPRLERTSAPPVLEPIRVRAKFFFEGKEKWFLKGVTYGPFKPNADGDLISTPEQARRDFRLMRELGVNLMRVYHVPPRWLLDLAASTAASPDLDSVDGARRVPQSPHCAPDHRDDPRTAVAKNKGHPAIFGYLVGNEVPTTMVRWLGAQRVIEFLEHLIDVAREADPRPLYQLRELSADGVPAPANVDFYSFNVYLERRATSNVTSPAAEPRRGQAADPW